jgi:hypothetical protein
MLYDGVPVQPVEAGVQSSMNWHLVKSADTAAQADANEHPWSHEDIQSINSMHSSNPILPLAFDLC